MFESNMNLNCFLGFHGGAPASPHRVLGGSRLWLCRFEASSRVTLPADAKIHVKYCNSEEGQLRNVSSLLLGKKLYWGRLLKELGILLLRGTARAPKAGRPLTPANCFTLS